MLAAGGESRIPVKLLVTVCCLALLLAAPIAGTAGEFRCEEPATIVVRNGPGVAADTICWSSHAQ